MLYKIIKYGVVIGATVVITASIPSCYRNLAYSKLKAAEGFPSWNRAENLKIKYVENGGKLETYVKDGKNMIPIYERENKLVIGRPEEECGLFTYEEKQSCIDAYKERKKEQSKTGNERRKNFSRWFGDKVRSGKDAIDEIIGGIKEGY